MRKIQLLFLIPMIAFLISCNTLPGENAPGTGKSLPVWFLNIEREEGIIIGYGEAETRELADEKARNDIASQIEVLVTSALVVNDRQDASGIHTSEYKQEIKSEVDLVLKGAARLENELYNGMYYSAWSYDNRPLRSRALSASAGRQSSGSPEKTTIKSLMPLSEFLRNNHSPANFQLAYLQERWYLVINDVSIPVRYSEFSENFYPLTADRNLKLNQGLKEGLTVSGQESNELAAGQLFSLSYTPAAENRYLNLFYIDNDGVTQLLIENLKMSGDTIVFPDPEDYDGLIAGKNEQHPQAIDLVLAVESSEPLESVSMISEVSSNQTDTEDQLLYGYGNLIEYLKPENCSSLLIKIRD